jgi:hypothetical protein
MLSATRTRSSIAINAEEMKPWYIQVSEFKLLTILLRGMHYEHNKSRELEQILAESSGGFEENF